MITHGDCIPGMESMEPADLIFADPPFNIGYRYDTIDDRLTPEQYLAWSERWCAAAHCVLKPDGTLWLASGDEYAAELKVLFSRYFFHRSWVIWYYTFGINCQRNFSRSHTHLFFMTKDSARWTWNGDTIRVPSARMLYGDLRANPDGRLPDNTWILRPQDLPGSFVSGDDTWCFPRVCGTFKERVGWHGCQMPEALLARIIRVSSHPGDLVLDPFAGSGSTLAVAKKLGRRCAGFELSADYAQRANERLAQVVEGMAIIGEK